MKLVRWILPLHLLLLAIATGIAIDTDRDGTRLLAWGITFMVTGWAAVLSAIGSILFHVFRRSLTVREVVMCALLILMGTYEKNTGTEWYAYIMSLPS